MTKKKQVGVRFDSNRTRLKTGETQRPNGTYAYRWSTPDGKRHSIYAPTLEKLREQEEQIIVDKHDGIRSDVKSITVNEMFDLWCQLKRGIKDSTFKNYIYMYELFVKPSFGKNRLVQVKKSDVRKFYNSLADGKVLKIATIDNVHNVLHQVFQVAVDDGMIRQNPTDNMLKELKLSHGFEREKKEALTVAQQKLFFDYMLSHPKDTHWYPVFYVMANTGMRVGEITGLRWSDIDLKKGIIRVNHTLVYYNHRDEKGCYFSINTPKTKAGELEIPMTEGVKQAFLMEREFQSQAEISSKSRVDGYDDFIFVNRYGDVQNQGNLNKALRRMMRDCNDEILEKYTLALFKRGTEIAAERGLILVDTKYEFGKHNGTIYLMDEIHTPDSSRYFYAEGYQERFEKGEPQKQLSKEFVREWLMENGFQGKDGQKVPEMTPAIVQSISDRYIELFENITGEKFVKEDTTNIAERIFKNVETFLNR